ncbi:hypothetical protein M3I53_00105 [Paraburkholderia sp. CNPSo 3272]|uniref:hypothetical protein n=1 Tax=Paraburkholderia sp. CNPSo 3272 TaxID=2940931 RepID=UPI0020B8ED5D|nr:hypothetical protein [Paraburkholderia sp. CNPSo 3272]MCP3721541.1 hypothetical protein [Paraburkholderia sp. CNPSo 3272]
MISHTPSTKDFMAGTLALALVLEGAGTGAALAQDNTGADRPTTAPATESSGAKANGVYPAPTQGVEQGVPASTGAPTARTTHSSKHTPHHAKKPVKGAAKETTNGAASASAAAGGSDARE